MTFSHCIFSSESSSQFIYKQALVRTFSEKETSFGVVGESFGSNRENYVVFKPNRADSFWGKSYWIYCYIYMVKGVSKVETVDHIEKVETPIVEGDREINYRLPINSNFVAVLQEYQK